MPAPIPAQGVPAAAAARGGVGRAKHQRPRLRTILRTNKRVTPRDTQQANAKSPPRANSRRALWIRGSHPERRLAQLSGGPAIQRRLEVARAC